MPTPIDPRELIHENDFFIGRHEVMFEAIKNYHTQDHKGESDELKLSRLTLEVNKAAARNTHLTTIEDKARVALEWDVSINRDHTPQDVLGFVNAAKAVTAETMPQLEPGISYGVNLSTIKIDEMPPLERIKLGMDMAERAKISTLDLEKLTNMNKRFETAASDHHLIDYAGGHDLTKLFDAVDGKLTEAEKVKKAQELQTLGTGAEMQVEQPQPSKAPSRATAGVQDHEKAETDEKSSGNWLTKILSSIGEFIEMIVGLIAGLFTGGGNNRQENAAEARQKAADKAVADTVQNLSKLKGADGKYSAALVDTNNDGIIDMKEIATVMGGQSPDSIKKDGLMHKNEQGALLEKLDVIIKNPEIKNEIKEIATGFRKSMEGLDREWHANVNAALPGAGKDASVKEGSR